MNYEIFKNVALYANYSSTFESPTLNELSNNPDGMGGFNANLAPQQAQSFEIGTKGRIAVSKGRDETDGIKGLHFDVAVFHIETKNDLVPYQIAGQTGKTFYRNAGETLRKGIEIGLTYPILKGLTAHLTQTFSDFQYKTYAVNTTVFDGKTLPGIPKTQTQIELRYAHSKGFFAILQARNVGQVFANDDNTASADSYSVVNVRLGSVFSLKFMTIEPFFGINNLTDTHYIANVLLNAASDRFFEPAALRYFFGGIKFRLK